MRKGDVSFPLLHSNPGLSIPGNKKSINVQLTLIRTKHKRGRKVLNDYVSVEETLRQIAWGSKIVHAEYGA